MTKRIWPTGLLHSVGALLLTGPWTGYSRIGQQYLEVVGAPDFEDGAFDILAMRKNLRIVKISKIDDLEKYRSFRFVDFKSLIDGGIIVQQSPINKIRTKDDFLPARAVYKGKEYAIDRQPTDQQYADMSLAGMLSRDHPTRLFVKDGVTVGIGTGEQDRVWVAQIAYSRLIENIRCPLFQEIRHTV
jgi:phosphoribosylaminoimidazolecarboxamide formyltransferase/IMP cyclohydrolase